MNEKESTKKIQLQSVSDLIPYSRNPRTHTDEQVSQIASSILEFGFTNPILVDKKNMVIAGHGRLLAARKLKLEKVPTICLDYLTETQKRAYVIADNKLALNAGWDDEMLKVEFEELTGLDFDMNLLGFRDEEISQNGNVGLDTGVRGSLSDKFGVPPFSVLNAADGWWQERKKQWISLGIESGRGRSEMRNRSTPIHKMAYFNKGELIAKEGGSIFDPVLAELVYRWFSPKGGIILDPFSGGSVRCIVASILGRKYIGVDLRKEQVEENIEQGKKLLNFKKDYFPTTFSNYNDLTPIEKFGNFSVKRDDLYAVNGVNGGKVRTCFYLAQNARGLVTAGSRASPQVNIVAHIAKELNIPCRVHTPEGKLSPEVEAAKNTGAEVIQHKAGYNTVITKRAKDDSLEHGFTEIPFGMECFEAVEATKNQVKNIPPDTKRIVIPVGSGMSLSGLLHGLIENNLNIPVLGVRVGADPTERLNKYAPSNWEEMVSLVSSDLDYHQHETNNDFFGLTLDPVYEAKCIKFLIEGDLLWVVGIRQTSLPLQTKLPTWKTGDSVDIKTLLPDLEADLVFSCPPYADLEVYSDDPRDISNLSYSKFNKSYSEIISKTCGLLKKDSFACFVVGEVRDKDGHYYNFVADTIEAFRKAGLHYYNETILVTPVGSLAVRVGNYFKTSRKLGKRHQNVLIFVKGDAREATRKCGECEFGSLDVVEEMGEVL